MFSGIIEETGEITRITEGADSIRLEARTAIAGADARVGDSIAVNGCCLTVVEITPHDGLFLLGFDLLRETWNRTNFRFVKSGSAVNLERSLIAGERIHGHFVTGHIDAASPIEAFERRGADWCLRVAAPREFLRFCPEKGSVAVDGISLTIAETDARGFSVWIIPHTRAVTALRERKPGDLVNLEADILAKQVAKLLEGQTIRTS